jgi:uncharacterized lipoprotein YmbA
MFRSLSVLFVLLLLVACASKEPLTRFFVLTSPNQAYSPVARSGPSRVFVRRVEVPAYLSRLSLASMTSTNQVLYSSSARWAESLDQGIARAVADDLTARGIKAVAYQPAGPVPPHASEVGIRVLRFEGLATGQVILSANWQIFSAGSDVPNVSRATNIELSGWTPGDEPRMATLLAEAVSEMAARIASALR